MSSSNFHSLRSQARSLMNLVVDGPARRRWQRERFFTRARKCSPVLAVDDRAGKRYLLASNDSAIGHELFVNREFEVAPLDNALRLLAGSGFVPQQVVDIGANIGTVTIELLSRLPGATGFAFEPERANFRLLLQNLIGNDLEDRVVCRQVAISDTDGLVEVELSPDNLGDHRVRLSVARGEMREETRASTTVQAWRLDSLIEKGLVTVDKPTLIWIDAQGHEAQILAGATQVVGTMPVVVEFWPYGLRRAGGYDAFIDQVRRYPTVWDIHTSDPRPVSTAGVASLGAALGGWEDFTDLLLIPEPLG